MRKVIARTPIRIGGYTVNVGTIGEVPAEISKETLAIFPLISYKTDSVQIEVIFPGVGHAAVCDTRNVFLLRDETCSKCGRLLIDSPVALICSGTLTKECDNRLMSG